MKKVELFPVRHGVLSGGRPRRFIPYMIPKRHGTEIRFNTLTQPDLFGEVPFFERVQDPGVVRAIIKALGMCGYLTVEKATIV